MEDAIKLERRRAKVRFSRRQLILGLLVLAAATGAGFGLYTWLGGEDSGAPSVRVITGVQFPYPAGWAEQPLTNDDKTAGLVLKLERQDPEASFLSRTVVARLAPDFDINALAADTARALKSDIQGLDVIRNDVTIVASLQAVQLKYRQPGDGDGQYMTLMTIIPQPNQTFYLTMRAREDEYARAEADGIQLMNTFAAYVNSANAQQ